jgi:hypothetical protein
MRVDSAFLHRGDTLSTTTRSTSPVVAGEILSTTGLCFPDVLMDLLHPATGAKAFSYTCPSRVSFRKSCPGQARKVK